MEIESRKLFHRRELPLFLLILAAAVVLIVCLHGAPLGAVAVVEVEGEEVARRELGRLTGPEELVVTGANGVELTVRFTPEGASVTEADCPDKTCVRTGLLTRTGDCAVCLPARVVLRLEGPGEAGFDAQTG